MATGSISKVRLVKCPKCMQLLPEAEDLAIYECGGCGTFLQAKIRRKPDVVQSSEQDNASQGQGSSSTTQNQTLDETLKNNLIEPDTDQLDTMNIPKEVSPSTQYESSIIVAQNPEVDSTETGCSNLGNLGPSGNSPKGDGPVIEDDASGLGASPSHQQVEEFHKSTVNELDRVTPIDTEQIHPGTELSDTINVIAKSLSAESANAYEASISSCDGIDNQVPKLHSNRYISTFGDEEMLRAQEILRKGKFPINSKNHYSKKCNMRDPNEPSRDEHRISLDVDESPTLPFRNPVGCENGSPSSHWHDEFKCNSTFRSPNKMKEDREKLKLLRLVYELQNQLDKTHLVREKAKQNSQHRNHEPRFDELYQDLNCPIQSRFSGEVINRRCQVNHFCLHCCPHHCQCAVHCHPFDCCCCYGPYGVHHYHNFCSVHTSRPRLDKETDKERYMNTGYHSQNLHTRSKQHFVKRHFRPVAGGAPFITCYHCLKPLQLPEDFFLHKRKCYQLTCGACSKDLKFSLQSNNHIFPDASCGADETGRATKWRSSSPVPVEAREKRVHFDQLGNKYKNPAKMHVTAAGPSSNKSDRERRP